MQKHLPETEISYLSFLQTLQFSSIFKLSFLYNFILSTSIFFISWNASLLLCVWEFPRMDVPSVPAYYVNVYHNFYYNL